MIKNCKIQQLTEDERCVLLYIINECKDSKFEFGFKQICWLNPKWVFNSLNQYNSSIKPEYKPMLQGIADKLFN